MNMDRRRNFPPRLANIKPAFAGYGMGMLGFPKGCGCFVHMDGKPL